MRRCSGYSLIEMMVVLTLTGVVGTLVLGAMLTMFRSDRILLEELSAGSALAQFEMQLRTDLHNATAAAAADETLSLTMSAGDQLIYRLTDDGISREQLAGEDVASRDWFQLPRGQRVAWWTEEEETGAWVTVASSPHQEIDFLPGATVQRQRTLRNIRFEIHVGRAEQTAGEERSP